MQEVMTGRRELNERARQLDKMQDDAAKSLGERDDLSRSLGLITRERDRFV